MGCYKRQLAKGVRFFYSGQYLGTKYFSKAIYLTKRECEKAERAKRDELDEEARRPKNEMALLALCEKRLDFLQATKSVFYYKENQRYFKKAVESWGNISARDISKQMVFELLMAEASRLKKSGKSNQKANSMIRSLKALFNWGNKIYDLDVKNPVRMDFLPITITLKYIPPEAEILAVKAECNEKQKLLLGFIDESACRVMEAVRLTFNDIDGDLMTLWTRKAKNSNLTPRRIPAPDCIKGLTGRGKVFTEWTEYPRFLEEKIRKLEFRNWNFHNLRHRRASIWANSGMTLIEIQHRLGHSNYNTTQRYLQLLGYNYR